MEEDFSRSVYISLLNKHPFMGIGYTAFMLVCCITMLLCTWFTAYCLIIGVVLYFILRQLCKKEPDMIDFILDNLFQKEIYTA